MDISYLLWLQDLRDSIGTSLIPFMHGVSQFASKPLLLFPIFIYWCVNKRKGLFIISSMCLTNMVNALIKLTACVYRPWIKDPRIVPAGNAIKHATGYSFPSGHTAQGVALYGGMAIGFWGKSSTKWISVLCVIGILLTGFSRNFLGVHTPQDVLVGLLLGVSILWLTQKIFNYLEKHPEKENYFLLGGLIFCVLSLVYINVKSYPMDYVDGKLIVDPKQMVLDAYSHIGVFAGFCVARYIEKRWIRFCPAGWTIKSIILGIVGIVVLGVMMWCLQEFVISLLGAHWGRFAVRTFIVIFVVALWPWVLKLASPLDFAREKNYTNVETVLKRAGAK